MLDFVTLKKLAKKEQVCTSTLVILGDCSTQHLSTAIKGYGINCELGLQVVDTDYNQISAQILDDNSELYKSNPDYVLIYMCAEKLYDKWLEEGAKTKFADTVLSEIKFFWHSMSSKTKARILQFNFVEINDQVFGNFGSKLQSSFSYQIRELNYKLEQAAKDAKNVFLVDLSSIQNELGRSVFFDPKFYYLAKIPVSLNALPVVAKNIIDVIKAIKGQIKKCVICDLDNTLWGGVIGDDGINGIQIGELGIGHAFEDLQKWLKALKDRGIILGICSKNNEDIAKEPFEKHPDMVLRMDDISIFVANWNDKATNIRYIQKTLNIGMDSIVFLDDNPFERNLVKEVIPEITVPDLPEDPSEYLPYLRNLNIFETASYSETDKQRTSQYKAEVNRIELEKMFENYDDYLQDLNMVARESAFDDFQTPRIAQLTQRSNQFNLRTVRLTEEDVKRIREDKAYITSYFTLKDKFGDHGLISLAYMKKVDGQTLFIENWLMSCRVLKRGMEEYVINYLVSIAKELGYKVIVGEYIKTKKNAMVENIYEKLGFQNKGNGKFEVFVDDFIPHNTFIKGE